MTTHNRRQHRWQPITWGITLSLIGTVLHLGATFASTSTDTTCTPDWYSDAYCDPENNIEECGYDGGDCCGCSCEDTDDYFCGVNGFNCQDPDQASCDFGTNTTAACGTPYAYSDGYCDSVNNNEDCRYDGGDCCSCTCNPDHGACHVNDSTHCLDNSTECYPLAQEDGVPDEESGSDTGGSDSGWSQAVWEISLMTAGAVTMAIAATG